MVDEVSLGNGVQGTLDRFRENTEFSSGFETRPLKYPVWTDPAPLLPPCQDCYVEFPSAAKCTCELDAGGRREVADNGSLRDSKLVPAPAASNVIVFNRELVR
jgi:hypothetical protein